MAGGKGTRIRSAVSLVPKILLPINNKPLIDYLINNLKKGKCNNVIICAGHLSRKIKEYIDKNHYDIPINLSIESKPLGTAGALSLIKNLLKETFVVLYGDIFTTIDIAKLLKFHLQNNADCTIVVRKTEHPQDSNLVSFNKSLLVKKFYFKPHAKIPLSEYGLTAIYMFNPEVLQLLPEIIPLDLEKDFLPILLKHKKKLVCYNTREFIRDIGTPERYSKILKLFKK